MWKGFQKPKRFECNRETLTATHGQFYAQPFERGFGTTIGNSLRRVLLASIEGAAITAVKIQGVLHEFSSIQGVTEDTTDIILDLQQIPVKISVGRPGTIDSRAGGTGEVKAGDIETNPNVEILDPDVHIATLSEEARLEMEMRVKSGRGYISADRNFDQDLDIGYIPIDSIHSPVRRVNYRVDDARLGQTTDYDKLILEVWTNGAVPPQDAVGLAAKLLKDNMSLFINFEDAQEPGEQATSKTAARFNENLNRSVEELELSVRSYNCLKNADIRTIGELVHKTEAEMLKTKNFGRKSLNEIKDLLVSMELELGIQLDGFPDRQELERMRERDA